MKRKNPNTWMGTTFMTHRSAILTSLGVWTLLFAATVSRADVVLFTNFGPGFSYNTGLGNSVGNAFDGNDYAQGDTFTPTTTARFSSLDIALSCSFVCADNFTVSLDANNGGMPGATIESFTVSGPALGSFGANNPPLVLDSVLNPLLTAGTRYWVTAASDLNNSIAWNLNSTGDSSSEALSADDGTTWFAPSGLTPGAYQVNGVQATPEPSEFWILIGLLGVLVFMRWRVRRLQMGHS
jgi:hypothetical protein